MESVVFETKP